MSSFKKLQMAGASLKEKLVAPLNSALGRNASIKMLPVVAYICSGQKKG